MLRLSLPRCLILHRKWFAGPKTVTHLRTNQAQRKVTTLIETNVLRLIQTGTNVIELQVPENTFF